MVATNSSGELNAALPGDLKVVLGSQRSGLEHLGQVALAGTQLTPLRAQAFGVAGTA